MHTEAHLFPHSIFLEASITELIESLRALTAEAGNALKKAMPTARELTDNKDTFIEERTKALRIFVNIVTIRVLSPRERSTYNSK